MTRYYYLGGQRVAMRQGGVLTYLHGDHLGSASLATDATGAKVSEQRYLPYGGTRSGEMPTDRQYTGQRREASLGFYDYVARQFDPALGRFLQADTIIPDPANPQSLNRYSYTLGNPLRYTDPTGHKECDRLCKGEKTDDRFIGSEYAGEWDPLFTAAQQYALLSPSGIGLYAQVDASYNLGADISTSLSGAIIFNWHSGEISLVPSLGAGLGLSEPGSHAGIGGGIIIPIGYSTNQSLVGGSEDSSVSLGLGASGSKDLSLDLGVSQEAEINFQTNETRPFFDDGTGIQPYSLTFGVSLSENQSYSPVKLPDISIYHGVSQTPVIFTVQLYPWNWD